MTTLKQDPHSLRDARENVLEVAIGRELRAFRKQQGMTVAELSRLTDISVGMLSKIENGNTSPSLTTLQALAHALSVPLTAFFRGYEERREAVHTRAGQGVEIERAIALHSFTDGYVKTLGQYVTIFRSDEKPFDDRVNELLADRAILHELNGIGSNAERLVAEGKLILESTDEIIALIDDELGTAE